MNKFILFLFWVTVFFLLSFTTIEAKAAEVTVYVDNEKIQYDSQPEITRSRTMVPIRHTMEALGSTVSWNNKTKTAVIEKGGNTVELRVGSPTAYRNGSKLTLDSPPYIKNSRTYLPFRFISEAFRYQVSWNNTTKVVSIASGYGDSSRHVSIPVLMYHHIQEGLSSGSVIPPAAFRSHMEAIHAAGYRTITDADLYQFLQHGGELPENPVLITFDDGYKSNFTYAYPVLKDLEMKATMNLITSRVVGAELLFPLEIPKVSWREAQNMQDVFSYQSHTDNLHYKATDAFGLWSGVLSGRVVNGSGFLETEADYEKRLFADLSRAKMLIETNLHQEVISLAYPFGDYSTDAIRIAAKAGYKMGFTTATGKVRAGHDPFRLNRINADGRMSAEDLITKMNQF